MSTVVVKGSNVMDPPLFDGEASMLEFRNKNGELECFWALLPGGTWGYCSKLHQDWDQMLVKYGYRTPSLAVT